MRAGVARNVKGTGPMGMTNQGQERIGSAQTDPNNRAAGLQDDNLA